MRAEVPGENVIRIKPHHVVDILTEYGAGREHWQPSEYGHALHVVAERVLRDGDVMLEMFSGADDICLPCIHNVDGLCDDEIDTSFRPQAPSSKREWNLLIDDRWYERLSLANHDRLTVVAFVRRLQSAVREDINGIYREVPSDGNAERLRKLTAGVAQYLQAFDSPG